MSGEALWIGPPGQRLFGVMHAARSKLRAGIVFCSPILHEYVRSHRLFALLAHELSGIGFSVLRFDYCGTGDSEGVDEEFSISRAATDAEAAVEHMRATVAGLPTIALGIRVGAFPAAHLARMGRCERLWLWQPVLDGADYVSRLRARDQAERISPMRYPRVRDPHVGNAQTLMGFPCSGEHYEQLQNLAWSNAGIDSDTVTLLDVAKHADSPLHSEFLQLPGPLSDWAEELDMARAALAPIRKMAGDMADGVIRK